jgi:predicted secreted Zn-dependent protease
MNRLGPGSQDAYTKWHVDWRYRYSSLGTACRIDSLSVAVDVVFTLPRWNHPSGASGDLKAEWNRYVRALLVHENGHKRLAERAGQRIFRRLTGLTAPCESIQDSANQAARSILAQQREREDLYDETTNHGASQGAAFNTLA